MFRSFPSEHFNKRTLHAFAVSLFSPLFLCLEVIEAEECTFLKSADTRLMVGSIGVVPEPSMNPEVVKKAIDYWTRCETFGTDFPALELDMKGKHLRRIFVKYQKIRNNPGDRKSCGWFSGNTITLFGYVRSAKGELHHCGTLAQNLAHELGHALGLTDAPTLPACSRHIMSDLDSDNLYHRSVTPDECRLVERRWIRGEPVQVVDLNRPDKQP